MHIGIIAPIAVMPIQIVRVFFCRHRGPNPYFAINNVLIYLHISDISLSLEHTHVWFLAWFPYSCRSQLKHVCVTVALMQGGLRTMVVGPIRYSTPTKQSKTHLFAAPISTTHATALASNMEHSSLDRWDVIVRER